MIFANKVIDFIPGENAGFGQAHFPEIVLGAPQGAGKRMGSFDVLSLGIEGEIILGFEGLIIDGEGDDFWVFENVFYQDGDEQSVFRELAEVWVSDNGIDYKAFPCDAHQVRQFNDVQSCAGVEASLSCDFELDLSSGACGGDAFDLEMIGVKQARFIKIKDLGLGMGITAIKPTAGFDLDAIVVKNYLSTMVD